MVIRDPQIEANEARYLTNEIINSITKSRALEDVLVIVSFSYAHDLFHYNNKLYTSYRRTILQKFNNSIEITDSKDNKNRAIEVKISSSSNKNKRIKTQSMIFTMASRFQLTKETC